MTHRHADEVTGGRSLISEPGPLMCVMLNQTDSRTAHLLPAVAVVSLQMPFNDGVWRTRLTLQEGAASLHPILHHLQGVLIGCR